MTLADYAPLMTEAVEHSLYNVSQPASFSTLQGDTQDELIIGATEERLARLRCEDIPLDMQDITYMQELATVAIMDARFFALISAAMLKKTGNEISKDNLLASRSLLIAAKLSQSRFNLLKDAALNDAVAVDASTLFIPALTAKGNVAISWSPRAKESRLKELSPAQISNGCPAAKIKDAAGKLLIHSFWDSYINAIYPSDLVSNPLQSNSVR